jgi:xanthine dehydrogenase molybdenum-binding subunit
MAHKHLGKDFLPHDVVAKVTGEAKYAEDFRAEGMVFARLLCSPSRMPAYAGSTRARRWQCPAWSASSPPDEVNNPRCAKGPAADQWSPATSARRCCCWRPRRDHGPGCHREDTHRLGTAAFPRRPAAEPASRPARRAQTDGNVGAMGVKLQLMKWTAADFDERRAAAHADGQGGAGVGLRRPRRHFARCKLVLDEPSCTPATRTTAWSRARRWPTGRTASASRTCRHRARHTSSPALAEMIGIPPTDLVIVAEYCGGGFGSKGSAYPLQALPALMSKKINRPVMMRISRAEEYYNGSARLGFPGQVCGSASPRTASCSPPISTSFRRTAPTRASGTSATPAMRCRWCTSPRPCAGAACRCRERAIMRSAQRGPGYNQIAHIVEPLLDKAARELASIASPSG